MTERATLRTRRQLFQFGLGTVLVVVTVLAVFLGYGLNWIRQRCAVVRDPNVESSQLAVGEVIANGATLTSEQRGNAPWPLRWLGEPGYVAVVLAKRRY